MTIHPLYTGFRSTTVWKAFVLNSIASSIIIFLAIYLKDRFDVLKDKHGNEIKQEITWKGVLITVSTTFIATFSTYCLLWFTLGYGGGMTS